MFNIKILFSIFSILIPASTKLPYLKNLHNGKTKPHIYTWLIWATTQGIAGIIVLNNNGGWGAINIIAGSLFAFGIFFFSVKKWRDNNITKIDTIFFIVALLAIIVWLQLDNPFLSLLMVTGIDVIGYIPSFRKSFMDPWSETIITWVGSAVGNMFALLALKNFTIVTSPYLILILISNLSLAIFCLVRRKILSKNIRY